ncbi:MAG: hypothetical protein RLZZ50_527 [Verrucomicrobiota bacterium]
MPADWQTPAAFLAVAFAAVWLLVRAWRKRVRSASGACGSSEEGCGCASFKKNLKR